jgi:IPT/TIG domain
VTRNRISALAVAVLAAMIWLPATSVAAHAATPSTAGALRAARANAIRAADLGRSATPACGPVQPGFFRCLALVDRATRGVQPVAGGSGYAPSDLQSAYNLPSSTDGAGRTVAVVDAYDDPTAEADLGTYRTMYGLAACTTTNGCFRKVNQSGATSPYPAANDDWASEISLDLDMVSAICPNCHILLVEADSDAGADLGTAENEAAALHATAISNSYGGPEGSFETSYDHYYDHPGIAITAGSGDTGYGVNFPAVSPYVTAVGGTSLQMAANSRGWTETAWVGAGSGCSGIEAQPSWQTSNANVNAVCRRRAVADVAADADPNTPVHVYDNYDGAGGWVLDGGTSAATPMIASVYALTSNATSFGPGFVYSHTAGLYDVTSGSNGSCGGSGLCTATTGWDGPTGLGTPDGISAFGSGGAPIISAVTPAAGPVTGGQMVTVSGDGFTPGMSATIGGTTLTLGTITAGTFQFVTPAGTAGYVQVTATTSSGTSPTTGQTGYIYTALSNYVSLSPFRILDTRSTSCIQCTGGALGQAATRTVPIAGYTDPRTSESVPMDAAAVAINVTEVSGSASSLLVAYPAGTGKPATSNLNFAGGTVIANLVTITLGESGAVDIFNSVGTVNVLADVEGYFAPQASSDVTGEFHPIAPVRVCDTRSASAASACRTHGAVVAGTPMIVNVTASGAGAISSTAASAAVLNVTGVAGSAGTYMSVFPTSSNGTCAYSASHPPPVSTLNLLAGAVEANRVMVELGPSVTGGHDTSVCVYNAVGTINVLLDANGWFGASAAAAGDQYQAIGPTRICDTRPASGLPCAGRTLGPLGIDNVIVAGEGGLPASGAASPALAVIANLTAVAPSAGTYLTLYPANLTTPPHASDLNINANEVLPNLAVVQIDTITGDPHLGGVDLFNAAGSVNALIDVEGWFQ